MSVLIGANSDLQKLDGLLWASLAGDLKLLPALLVAGDEEFFCLPQKGRVYVRDTVQILVIVGMNSDTEKAVVRFGLSVLRLFSGDDANDAHFDETADVGRGVHQHHNVEWITILPQCAGIGCELISASPRGLDDNSAGASRGVQIRECS